MVILIKSHYVILRKLSKNSYWTRNQFIIGYFCIYDNLDKFKSGKKCVFYCSLVFTSLFVDPGKYPTVLNE
jgi:hypothetical protein